jgi:hypothetical protein
MPQILVRFELRGDIAMTKTDDAPLDTITVIVALNTDGTYSGTFSTPDSGSFADAVTCEVLVDPPIPTGTYAPSCSSPFFGFSISPDLIQSTPGVRLVRPVSWTTFQFCPSPISWTSEQTITVTMTSTL